MHATASGCAQPEEVAMKVYRQVVVQLAQPAGHLLHWLPLTRVTRTCTARSMRAALAAEAAALKMTSTCS